jgi:hypothetical protein
MRETPALGFWIQGRRSSAILATAHSKRGGIPLGAFSAWPSAATRSTASTVRLAGQMAGEAVVRW